MLIETKQQAEALRYFNDYADDWHNKARSNAQTKVNVIQQRNNYVLQVIRERAATAATLAATASVLDVGCGTGDLVCDIARQGITASGVDFAPEMIEIAQSKARQQELANAQFYSASIFDFDLSTRRYDVVSANGFIEYISLAELDRFLALAYQALNPGGSLVLGSRNRLFNIFSLNSYTLAEIEQGNGNVSLLLKEAVALAAATDFAQLLNLETAPLQDVNTEHASTGINVTTRYQFTPVQLLKMLQSKGFETKQIYPIHVHGVSPSFKQQQPQLHTGVANLLQTYAGDHLALVPQASSFMLHAQRVAAQQVSAQQVAA
jgi:2-polyprenyl-3-methyl-5-hydroxy-6-metoxy-1,4-benzoquinol methylase